MKNYFDKFISRLDMVKEIRSLNIFQYKPLKLRNKEEKKQNIQELWDSYKRHNVRVMGMPEKDRKKGRKALFGIMISKNFPKSI